MPWDDADYYLLNKVKRLESQLDYLLSRVSSISQSITIISGANGNYSGTTDPNVAGLVPTPPILGANYQQYDVDGITPRQLWWWHIGSQTWV